MSDILDRKIIDTFRVAHALEEMSDTFFAQGNPGRGALYFRLATETFVRAEALAKLQGDKP